MSQSELYKPRTWSPPIFTGEPRPVLLSPARAITLECLCRGHNTEGIAQQMHVSIDTVKSHLRMIFKALGAKDRVHAVVLVYTGQVTIQVAHKKRENQQ